MDPWGEAMEGHDSGRALLPALDALARPGRLRRHLPRHQVRIRLPAAQGEPTPQPIPHHVRKLLGSFSSSSPLVCFLACAFPCLEEDSHSGFSSRFRGHNSPNPFLLFSTIANSRPNSIYSKIYYTIILVLGMFIFLSPRLGNSLFGTYRQWGAVTKR